MKKTPYWPTIFVIGFVHIVAFLGVWHTFEKGVSFLAIIVFIVGYFWTGLGVTVGFHRFYTHRSFQTSKVVAEILLALGEMALQGNRDGWRTVHLAHHRAPDTLRDPHSPVAWENRLYGFYWAHIGWLFFQPLGNPSASDRTRSLGYAFLGLFLPGLILFVFEGWDGALSGTLLAGFMRVVFVWHATWSVNSIGHLWGSRPFPTKDNSRDSWIIGMFGLGDGYHNFHHAFPWSAINGFSIPEKLSDTPGTIISAMGILHLAWNIQSPDNSGKIPETQPGLISV
ncbi:MAG: acyl-CoA desaturase [bacterium]|nr:acyl-CoA desaturase [bacterium]